MCFFLKEHVSYTVMSLCAYLGLSGQKRGQ